MFFIYTVIIFRISMFIYIFNVTTIIIYIYI